MWLEQKAKVSVVSDEAGDMHRSQALGFLLRKKMGGH
jgi:hypothetical protein